MTTKENIIPPDSLVISYLHGGRFRYQAGESLGPRRLTDYEIVLILEGDVIYNCDDAKYRLQPGSIVLGCPGSLEKYCWDREKTTYHAFIHFGIESTPSDWPPPEKWPHVRINPDPAARPLLRHILRHVNEHPNWPIQSPGRAECRLVETLIDIFLETHITDDAQLERDRPEPIRRALNRMKLNIEEIPVLPLTLAELAREASVTEKHLCRLFTRNMGYTPMRTYSLLRLQYGITLLTRSNLSIKEIAERCGYEDPLYFSRAFSKTYKISPSQMRKDLREGHPPPATMLPADITPRLYW